MDVIGVGSERRRYKIYVTKQNIRLSTISKMFIGVLVFKAIEQNNDISYNFY